jgi:hypothetical protein
MTDLTLRTHTTAGRTVFVRAHRLLITFAICPLVLLVLVPGPARAQFLGHNFHGDYGLQSATQPPPGFWLAALYLRYDGDRLLDRNGDEVRIDPEGRGEIDINSYVLGLWWVSKTKVLGANYSLAVFPAFTDNVLEAPILGLEQKTDTGFTDLYIQPINLGWHTQRADYMAGLGVYAPTGRYDPDANDNLGLGMWSFEIFGGATAYFDEKQSWHFATTAFYETHTEKEDSDITVGDILTLEGGLGKSFKEGAILLGAAYYAQWKITDDDLGFDLELPDGRSLGKHRVYGLGPELTLPIATKKRLIGFVNLRYFWEFGARTTLEGNTFTFTLNFPIPSISLG